LAVEGLGVGDWELGIVGSGFVWDLGFGIELGFGIGDLGFEESLVNGKVYDARRVSAT
jgi:hypothetical protein